jgi:phosphate transport system protein
MPGTNRHILSEFDAALSALRDNVIMMASLTQRNLEHARQGLFNLDEDHCNTAIADDEEIDALERQMDTDGMTLLMRFQPVASDLRVVIATMKISVNLERVSDLAMNIARRARKLIAPSAPSETEELRPLFEHATGMFNDAVAAISTGNLDLVRTLKTRDQELATRSQELAGNITTRMSFEVGDGVARYLELIFILRYLEQIGNLSTNLGEDAILAYSREAIRSKAAEETRTGSRAAGSSAARRSGFDRGDIC